MMPLALMHQRDAGYPIGGSLVFARAIERRYLDLGGHIHYPLARGQDSGRGRPGGGYPADGRHGASGGLRGPRLTPGHVMLYEMLDGKYLDDKLRGYYEGGL